MVFEEIKEKSRHCEPRSGVAIHVFNAVVEV
jgi:hypothetical protein